MDKIVGLFCTLQLLLVPVLTRRSQSHGHMMGLAGTSALAPCCFVDIFCYTTCVNSGYDWRAFVAEDYFPALRTPDHRRHRHHHGEGARRRTHAGFVPETNGRNIMRRFRRMIRSEKT